MEGRCRTCNTLQKHLYREHVDAKGKKFLNVMAGEFSDGITISEELIKQCKLGRAKAVDLKGPSGGRWRVKLRKAVDCMFHGDGWRQFLSKNQVDKGDCLVFEYNGDSCFGVTMFDGGGLEKIPPYFANSNFSHTKIEEAEELEDDSQENSSSEDYSPEDSSSGNLSDSSSEVPLSTPEKCHNNNKRRKAASETNNKQDMRRPEGAKTEKLTWSSVFVSRRRPVTNAERASAINRGRKIRLPNPSFLTVMQPTHVSRRFFMTIPIGFAERHISRKKQTIILRLPDQEEEWHVSYCLQLRASGLSGLAWCEFVYDNNLEEGDACVFELTPGLKVLVMNVHIFRIVEEIEPLTVGRKT